MYEDIQNRTEVMDLFELQEDHMYEKLSREECCYYIQASVKEAHRQFLIYQQADLRDILKTNGVTVCFDPHLYQYQMVYQNVQSQILFCEKEKRIDIFVPFLEEKSSILREMQFDITTQKLMEICLAHEFYHFLEYQSGKFTGELLKKKEYKFFGCTKRKVIKWTSEVAAHHFAMEMCQLNFHPKITDYYYQIKKGAVTEEHFIGAIEKAQQFLKGGDTTWEK